MSKTRWAADPTSSTALAFAVAIPGIALVVAIGWAYDWWKAGGYFDHWQTLVSGVIAVVAAGVSVAFVNKQIRQADLHEQDRIARRFDACRAMLPLTLSALCAHCRDCARYLLNILATAENKIIPVMSIIDTPPTPGTQITVGLREMIEASPEQIRGHIATLLGDLQVLWARIGDIPSILPLPGNIISQSNIESFVINVAEVYASASGMFDFSRRQTDVLSDNICLSSIHSALKQLGIYEIYYPRIYAHAAISHGNSEERQAAMGILND